MTQLADVLLTAPDTAAETISRRLDTLGIVLAPVAIAAGVDLPRQVADSIADFLAMPVGNIVFWAWDKHHAVQRACLETRDRPGATLSLAVGRHTLTATHRPRIRLDVAGQDLPLLDLELSLTVHVVSIVIEVREGQVTGSGPGHASVIAELGAARPGGGSPVVLLHKETPRVTLPPCVRGSPNRLASALALPEAEV
jgi:hypothetical protein